MTWEWIQGLEKRGVRFVLLAAAAATALTFLTVRFALPPGSYIRTLFLERTFIQYLTTFCFWLTVVCIGLKHIRFKHEQKAFDAAREILSNEAFEIVMTWQEADTVRRHFLQDKYKPFHNSQIFEMILHGMDRLRKCQSPSELDDYFRSRSAVNQDELETGYTNVRYLLWLIPTLGFIGTVLGIGVGLAGFAAIIQKAEGFQQVKASLPKVTANFATAFDTTLLALVLSVAAVFYMSWMLKRQEHMLEKIDMLCFDEVCALFEEHDRASMEIVEAMKKGFEQLRTAMNGNRADIENVMQHKIPPLIAAPILQGMVSHLTTLEGLLADSLKLQNQSSQFLSKLSKDSSGGPVLTQEHIRPIENLLKEIRDLLQRSANKNPSPSIPDSV
ncbi:MAG TPA: MotA/TolQ/ExbB proton channel family protein [Anaerohalosphaeraceae bacterium]|nr:MotA/TolQ/ExbB proton channel family protein [Anaerohalosphaeraceae bacterium]